ncbi:VOC family protein [Roseibium alexandrii]|jgi:catechol 2,3-dioxygenase-like lactoylglutathione lyase family enzyme|uniref:Putative enzyme related to lactoylglutathione lyase n=2 Tax=Roseibium alexandrii TaxID=388408 RepID=A0A0M6ZZW8_9HYPH|nr:VOC family protein [Roseibium alexandrii]EEE47667.1 putative lactoylglutathione lyase [Roseibium alexandrii DFL-11]CTQ67861.1 putative enzyme related to lactoylglutathione lyase [Roseibium alexandrii]
MDQRISMITLIVPDIMTARAFFETGLGWQVNAAPSPHVVFFQIPGGVFALYDRNALEDEIGSKVTTAPFGAMTLAWNAKARDDVDTMFAKAVAAGARSVKEPQEAFWGGYSSYVEVPGRHLLEIAFNPFWTVTDDGSVLLPDPQP